MLAHRACGWWSILPERGRRGKSDLGGIGVGLRRVRRGLRVSGVDPHHGVALGPQHQVEGGGQIRPELVRPAFVRQADTTGRARPGAARSRAMPAMISGAPRSSRVRPTTRMSGRRTRQRARSIARRSIGVKPSRPDSPLSPPADRPGWRGRTGRRSAPGRARATPSASGCAPAPRPRPRRRRSGRTAGSLQARRGGDPARIVEFHGALQRGRQQGREGAPGRDEARLHRLVDQAEAVPRLAVAQAQADQPGAVALAGGPRRQPEASGWRATRSSKKPRSRAGKSEKASKSGWSSGRSEKISTGGPGDGQPHLGHRPGQPFGLQHRRVKGWPASRASEKAEPTGAPNRMFSPTVAWRL